MSGEKNVQSGRVTLRVTPELLERVEQVRRAVPVDAARSDVLRAALALGLARLEEQAQRGGWA